MRIPGFWPIRWALAGAVALAVALVAPMAAGAAEAAIDREVVVAASLDEAWQAWTTREGIVAFFAPDARIEPRVGGAFEIFFDPGAPAGAKGADDMRILAIQPKKMLSFTWNAPPHLPEVRAQRTVVVLRFAPIDDTSTRVTLHHTGWGEGGQWDQAHAYFERAWTQVLSGMKKRFEQGPTDWTPWLKQLEAMRARPAASAPSAPR